MGCRLIFVVDLVEEIVCEGGSRSAWRAHEHENFQIVSQQNVAIRVFWNRSPPRLTLNALIVSTQRVSPFYRDLILLQRWSSCFNERNVYRFLENGALFLSNQRVSPFYHDLDWGLIWLVGNFLLVEQLLLLVVEQLLNPILSSNYL